MLRTNLRSSQSGAVARALEHDGFALFHEQRVGKTLTALSIVDHLKPDRLLIVSIKKGVAEFARQIKDRFEFDWKCELQMVNFERLWKGRKALRKWLQAANYSMIIIDECHRIKRRSSKFYKAARYITWLHPKGDEEPIPQVGYRLVMSGTPISEGIEDAWPIFDIVNPAIFGPWRAFRRRYLKMHGLWKSKVIGYKKKYRAEFLEILHRHSDRITLREARRQEGRKPLKIRVAKRYAEWDPRALKAYEDLERDLITMIEVRDRERKINRKRKREKKKPLQVTVTTPLIITQIMKLQQLTGGFVIDDSKRVRPIGRSKLELVRKILLEEVKGKCVIVSRFRHEIRALKRLCEEVGRSVETIQGGVEFSGKQTADVAIVQVASGVAIDLSASKYIIFYSWDYSYINFEQTKFRVLSFETTSVHYFFLFIRGSIDEEMYQAVSKKQNVARFVCDKYRWRKQWRTNSKQRSIKQWPNWPEEKQWRRRRRSLRRKEA